MASIAPQYALLVTNLDLPERQALCAVACMTGGHLDLVSTLDRKGMDKSGCTEASVPGAVESTYNILPHPQPGNTPPRARPFHTLTCPPSASCLLSQLSPEPLPPTTGLQQA